MALWAGLSQVGLLIWVEPHLLAQRTKGQGSAPVLPQGTGQPAWPLEDHRCGPDPGRHAALQRAASGWAHTAGAIRPSLVILSLRSLKMAALQPALRLPSRQEGGGKTGESTLLSRSGGEKGPRCSGAGNFGVLLESDWCVEEHLRALSVCPGQYLSYVF